MRDSVRKDCHIVTIAQEHCPWIIPLGSHVANGNLTFELTINQVDEFARRRLDWLVVNDKQPQVQLYINLKDKPDHCLLLLHTELVKDQVSYIKAIDLPFEHVDSRKANKRDHREVILHKRDWEMATELGYPHVYL